MSAKVQIALLALIGAAALSVAAAFLIQQLRPSDEHKTAYQWSPNLTIAPPETGKQRAEATLATDKDGRIWLSYLDADYSHGSGVFSDSWFTWPRRLTIVSSDDQGKTFGHPYVLSPMGDNASFTNDVNGNLYASWVKYSYDDHKHLEQRIVAARLDGQSPVQISTELQCPVWVWPVAHYAANMTVSNDGTIHIVGVDTYHAMLPSDRLIQRLLYARSTDGLNSCTNQIRLPAVGGEPQVVSTRDALLIVGAIGFYSSVDNGETFGPRQLYDFGYRFARAAADPSRRIVYVVGDAKSGGLWLSASPDGGKSWKRTRIDDGRRATAWRFPAITVSKDGRVHVVWMDDREGYGALYHAYSDDGGRSFSKSERVSDRPFPFPPLLPVIQQGTWIGDYLSVTTVVDANSFWVDGYFEETNFGAIDVGDAADIRLMGYSAIVRGHVESISRAINVANAQPNSQGVATVNPIFTWVRLAQRVPVRVHLDDVPSGVWLVAGMTATVQIDRGAKQPDH